MCSAVANLNARINLTTQNPDPVGNFFHREIRHPHAARASTPTYAHYSSRPIVVSDLLIRIPSVRSQSVSIFSAADVPPFSCSSQRPFSQSTQYIHIYFWQLKHNRTSNHAYRPTGLVVVCQVTPFQTACVRTWELHYHVCACLSV